MKGLVTKAQAPRLRRAIHQIEYSNQINFPLCFAANIARIAAGAQKKLTGRVQEKTREIRMSPPSPAGQSRSIKPTCALNISNQAQEITSGAIAGTQAE
jgi:hypothetical protein